jgi:hypothetical protein
MEFSEQIKSWVAQDNRIKKFQEEIRNARIERNQLADSIISYAESNNMSHAVVQITDGRLKFQSTRNAAPLTFRFIKQCLSECLEGPEIVEQIMKYIKDKREIRYTQEIKRFYNS